MKSTDLMIGDYFTVIESNPSEKAIAYAKVVDIDRKISIESYTVSTEYPYFDDSGKEWVGLFSCSIDRLQPIPLTPEILEKNGWKKYKNKRWMYFKDGCDKFNILLGNNSTEIEYLNMIYNPEDNAEVNYGSNFEFPRKIYVHELQHALKLCGIEKEIVL